MGRLSILLTLGVLLLHATGCAHRAPSPGPSSPPSTATGAAAAAPQPEVTTMPFTVTSSAFKDGERIPARHTADGADVSPPLSWTRPPDGTAALALIVDDPDAPRGTWVHWVIYNLPPDPSDLPEAVPTKDVLPDLGGAKQGLNDFGKAGYGGPAPPRGPAHHYRFTLYALDAQLNLPARAQKADVEKAMQGHILTEGRLVGLFSR